MSASSARDGHDSRPRKEQSCHNYCGCSASRCHGTGSEQARARPWNGRSGTPTRLTCRVGGRRRAGPTGPPRRPRGLQDLFTLSMTRNIGAESWPQQVRTSARPLGGSPDSGLVGRQAAVPYAGVRVHPSHRRPSTLSDTTFHLIDASPTEACGRRRSGQRQGRTPGRRRRNDAGVLDADLVETMRIAGAPVELGPGRAPVDVPPRTARWLPRRLVPIPSGVTHHLFWRR